MNNIKETIDNARDHMSQAIHAANRALVLIAPLAITGMIAGGAAAVGVGLGAVVSLLDRLSDEMSSTKQQSLLRKAGGALLPSIIGGALGGALMGGSSLALIGAVGAGIGVGVMAAAHFSIAFIDTYFVQPRNKDRQSANARAAVSDIATLVAVAAIGLTAYNYSDEVKQLSVIKQLYEQKNPSLTKDFNGNANSPAVDKHMPQPSQMPSPKQG